MAVATRKRSNKTNGAVPDYKCCQRCKAAGDAGSTITLRKEKPSEFLTIWRKRRYYKCKDGRCGTTWSIDFTVRLQILSVEIREPDRR